MIIDQSKKVEESSSFFGGSRRPLGLTAADSYHRHCRKDHAAWNLLSVISMIRRQTYPICRSILMTATVSKEDLS